MKIGMNLLLWATHVTEEHFPVLEKLKAAGYDGVEVPIFEGEPAYFETIRKALDSAGLECTSVTVIPDEAHSPISPDAKNRQAAVDYLKQRIDCSAAMGSKLLCGPFHQPLGQFSGAAPSDDEKKWAAEVHRQAAEYAEQAEVVLAIEYLNRFECYFINTMADAAAHVERVWHPNFGTMYDTFHANIEEKDPVGVIEPHIKAIRHFHVSANDRGTPGKDHVDWAATFKALKAAGYDDWVTIEAFGQALPDLAAATRVWRPFFESREEVYEEGIKLIKEMWEA